MNRRGFLKALGAISAVLSLPVPQALGEIKKHLWVNVRWFGAKGDGITDDSEAFRKAVEYARKFDVKEVRVPPGVYSVSRLTNDSTLKIIGAKERR